MKRLILWISALVLIAVVVAGVFYFARKPGVEQPAAAAVTPTAPPALPPNSTPKPGQVLLVEYSDFECPACAKMYPLVEGIRKEFGGRIEFDFRNFPLDQIHANARRAAWAAEAAGQQGKFWEMGELLFKHQPTWSVLLDPVPEFSRYAEQLKLDGKRFRADYDSFVVHSKVDEDARLGMQDRILHTPTVFLNGKEIEPKSYAEFRNLVDQALAKNR